MAKKKVTTTNSVALFDEEPPVKKAPVKVSKETKKKNGNNNKNSNSSTSNVAGVAGNGSKQTKKKDKSVRGNKQSGTPDTAQKSRKSTRSIAKSDTVTKQPAKRTKKSDEPVKNDPVKKSTRRDKEDSNRSTKASVDVGGEKQAVNDGASPDFAKAKRNYHRFQRGPEIWPPKQITGNPKPIKDGELLAIIVDGEYLEVSPWSVKDGIYRQGFDGNFLVKYLYYETVSTKYDALNEELSNITKKKEKK